VRVGASELGERHSDGEFGIEVLEATGGSASRERSVEVVTSLTADP